MLSGTLLLILASGLSLGFSVAGLGGPDSLQYEDRPTSIEALVSQLQNRVDNQDSLLHEAHDLIRQQARQLARQQDVLRQQALTLQHHEELLERFLSKAENADSQSQVPGAKTASLEDTSKQFVKKISAEVKKPAPSASPRLHPRSDDNGPLQIAVDHMAQQITQMDAQITALQNAYHQVSDVQASSFVRWGHSQCGDAAELVYAGVIGGSWYNHHGGANPLCLTMQPVLSNASIPNYMAYLYGAEYFTYDSHYQKDPVCAVCRSRRSTTVMVPGTNVCTAGWQLEYSGFLMAGYYNQHGGSQFICVDSALESRMSSDKNEYGSLLYYTVTQCGSLPCEPYVNNKIVTCAVCSK